MRRGLASVLAWILVVASLAPGGGPLLFGATTPRLLTASFLGTEGHDDLQAAAIAEDGTIYVVGNLDSPSPPWLRGAKCARLGRPLEGTWYRCGFVAALSPDGRRVLGCVCFARGQVFLTSVAVAKDGVYVGGYGMPQVAGLIEPLGGLFPAADRANAEPLPQPLPDLAPPAAPEMPEGGETLTIHTRHHGDKGGVPLVLRFNARLDNLLGGTFLEGHHYAWNIAMPSYEEEWTPVDIALLPGGDLVVLHDGGAPVHHYFAPDYVSRLSADLARRAWRFDIYHPQIEPIDKIRRRREEFRQWKLPVLGQIRALRMRGDGRGHVYVGGWSVSMTSQEPWWCPFLWKIDQQGKVVWRAYSFDPMGGEGNRMGGLVSDSAIRSMAVGGQGDLLVAGISDGGNTVLRRDPRDYTRPVENWKRGYGGMKGRVLYVGHAMKLDTRTAALKVGTMLGSYGDRGYQATWAVDVAGLPGGRALLVGRHHQNYPHTPDAWFCSTSPEGMFLKVLDGDFEELFSVNLADVVPYAAAARAERCVVVGMTGSDATPVRDPIQGKRAGGLDGYLVVADVPE